MSTIERDDLDLDPYTCIPDDEVESAVRQMEHSTDERTRTPSERSSPASSNHKSDQEPEQTTEDPTTDIIPIPVAEQTQPSTEPEREESTEQTPEKPEEPKQTNEEPTQEQPSGHSDTEVNGSQFQCWPDRVVVSGSGLAGGVLGQKLTFTVDSKNAGPGELTAFCTGPNQLAYCELTDQGDGTYTLSARPQETGDHVLQVEYEGEPVPGSPFSFPVTVQSSRDDVIEVQPIPLQCWPSRVLVTGSGLAGGFLGQELTYHVDARDGGPGVLTAYCTGPHRLAYCQLTDHGNGTFTLSARPEETGEHVLQIKYEGESVQGSPFIFPVTGSSRPDATGVRVSGPGVENGILSTFQSDFAVDTKGAGAGNLSIRMQGPKGAFRMEMSRMTSGDRKVFCHYNPRSTGVYVIIVRWSNVDVPGSPFQVKIFDNPHEMERDLDKQS